MREVSATEASRNFSAVLDSAEQGETILVTRGGEPVATIAPAPRANGAALLDLFARYAATGVDDEAFAETVAKVRDVARADLDSDPWHG
ncbi:MAG: type II toxin-antitoxin system prevent-host-death family antitoxin [Pseudonocardiaceae bacterium]|nr:type II toxin-antitoxin system prevent-host-death family antitoxin [Pseudonocardiaceae bacterium]